MNQDPSESSETENRPTRRLLGIEGSDFPPDYLIDRRRPVLDSLPHRTINRRREKIWNERCEPGHLPCLNLPSAAIGFLVGIGLAVYLGAFVRNVATDATEANEKTPPSYPVETRMKDDDVYENGDIGFMMSEAGMDHHAQNKAEKLRHKTERRLAQIDEIMVWRLDDWRRPLATFQDMMVQLAGVGTGGGTWVGHEMQRNDLTLETDLLELHAEGLTRVSAVDIAVTPEAQMVAMRRMEEWQSLLQEFESTAESLRASPETTDFLKSHLDSTMDVARESHALLGGKLAKLKDTAAAQAVIDFCNSYFWEMYDVFLDDESTEER